MLNLHAIERHFHLSRFDQLADAVAANGLGLSLPLRVRLSASTTAAIALGLKRVTELTYGPTTLGREMTRSLLDAQQPDGSFEGDPLATAAALAALNLLQHDQPGGYGPQTTLARDHALAALAAMQDDEALFRDRAAFAGATPLDRTEQDRALTTAFILFLLGRDQDFRAAVRFADLLDWFDLHAHNLDEDTRQLFAIAIAGLDIASQPTGPGHPGYPGQQPGHPVGSHARGSDNSPRRRSATHAAIAA